MSRAPFLLLAISGALLVSACVAHPAHAWNCFGSGGGCGGGDVSTIPTVTVTANPTSITEGQSTDITWWGYLVSNCNANFTYTYMGMSGAPGGYTTDYPSSTKTYTVTCTGQDPNTGQNIPITGSATVTVTPATGVELTAGSVSPTTVTGGVPTTLSASIMNIGTANTPTGFTNLFQLAGTPDGLGAQDIGTSVRSSPLPASSSFEASISYTFPSVTNPSFLYVRACADKSSGADAGTVSETNEGNNCGPWTQININPSGLTPAGSVSCNVSNASPALGQQVTYTVSGGSSPYTWTPSNPSMCTMGTNATLSCTYTIDGPYTMSVTPSGDIQTSCTLVSAGVTNGTPTATISANPLRVAVGKTSIVTWSSTNATSCTVSGPGLSSTAMAGSAVVRVNAQQRYTITCNGATAFVIVNTTPIFKEF